MKDENLHEQIDGNKKDGNTCLALGAGVGVLGAAGAVIAGAVCPLCYFIAPGLLGIGAYKRWKAADLAKKSVETERENGL